MYSPKRRSDLKPVREVVEVRDCLPSRMFAAENQVQANSSRIIPLLSSSLPLPLTLTFLDSFRWNHECRRPDATTLPMNRPRSEATSVPSAGSSVLREYAESARDRSPCARARIKSKSCSTEKPITQSHSNCPDDPSNMDTQTSEPPLHVRLR